MMGICSITAQKDDYIAIGSGNEAEVITILEAQMEKLPGGDGGGAPGFVLITAIFAIGATGIILKKTKR